jgi:hypothetical protein
MFGHGMFILIFITDFKTVQKHACLRIEKRQQPFRPIFANIAKLII